MSRRLLAFGLLNALSAIMVGQTYIYQYETTRFGTKPGPNVQTPEQKMKMLGEAGLRYATDNKRNLELFQAEAKAEQQDFSISGNVRVSASDLATFFEMPTWRMVDHVKPQFETMPTWFSGQAIVEPHKPGGQRPGLPIEIESHVRDFDDHNYVSNLAIAAALTNKVPGWWKPISGPWQAGEEGYEFSHDKQETYVIVKREHGQISEVDLSMDKERRVRYHKWIVKGGMEVGRTLTYQEAGDWGKHRNSAQSYKLIAIEPGERTDLSKLIPIGESMHDLRLKDGHDKVESLKLSSGRTLYTLPSVDYNWDGHLPNMDELRKIDDKAHTEPSEPGMSMVSVLPVLGVFGVVGVLGTRRKRRISS